MEVFLRLTDNGYGNAPKESDPILHHVHPKNYEFASYDTNGEYGGHKIYYDKNGSSSLNPNKKIKIKNNKCRIAFLGDSFTEAGQVDYEESFVGILDKNSNCVVKNFGVSSYSPIIYLLQWNIIKDTFKPTHVFVQLYSNDIAGDKKYYLISEKDNNGNVVAVPGNGNDWFTKQLRKSYLVRFIRKMQLKLKWMFENPSSEQLQIVSGMVEENPDISKLSSYTINLLNKNIKSSGVKFILTVVPSKYKSVNKKYSNDDVEFSDKWKAFASKYEINFLDLTNNFEKYSMNGFKLFYEIDIHFNKNGHKLVAKAIMEKFPKLFINDIDPIGR